MEVKRNALALFASGVALVALTARLSHPRPSPTLGSESSHNVRQRPAQGLDFATLYRALIEVESGGDPHAVGDGGKAVGVLQIHPVMVRDVNRILGYDRWTLEDRWSAAESRAMFEVYLDHYGATSYEEAARKWNGGPRGPSKEATVPYWEKVRIELEKS